MTFLIIVLALVLLCVILLCLPLGILILADVHGSADVRVRFTYFFKLFAWGLHCTRKEKVETKATAASDIKRSSWVSRSYDLLQTEGLWHRVWTLLQRLRHGVQIVYVDADVKFSLGDDYYTGMLTGLLLPLVLFSEQWVNGDIKIQPAFEEDLILDGYLHGNLMVRPVKVLIPFIIFCCSRPVWRARRNG
ncbi:MAG: hypothetical protein NT082_07215, partial [Chloroflexi bacterium]|nr:hypothetical protein [Chloroflexota bacterium]